MDKMREEFEAWLKGSGNLCCMEDNGEYSFQHTHHAWNAWKASRAALCVELPENCKGMALSVDEFHQQLGKAGVSYKQQK